MLVSSTRLCIVCSYVCADHVLPSLRFELPYFLLADLNYMESSGGVADVVVAVLPRTGEVSALQLENKLPLAQFEEVMQVALEVCGVDPFELCMSCRLYPAPDCWRCQTS
jgi:3' exoribonuclease family protein